MRFKIMFGILVIFLLTGCGSEGLDGDYTFAGGTQEFRFSPDGIVAQSLQGKEVAKYKYEKDGNEIKIYINGNTAQIWTLQENGDLSFQMPVGGGVLTFTEKK